MGKPRRIRLFIVASVLLHALAYYRILQPSTKPVEVVQKIEVEYLEAPIVKTIMPVAQPKIEQVVEQDKPLNHKEDKDTKFLSSFTQKVERETRAKAPGKFQNGGEMLKDLSKTFAMDKGGELPKPEDSNAARSQTDDYLKDLEEGMNTVVNTREFAYFAYFNKIKESLRHQWEPDLRSKMTIIRRKERDLASASSEKAAQLLITLDKFGDLIRVEVVKSSGNHVLDELAVNAFKKAAPFPNPPAGIVEADGNIKIRWDFILAI